MQADPPPGGGVLHLDVMMVLVIINIIGILHHQQENAVNIVNVYANQKHVTNALSIHTVTVVPIQHAHLVQKRHHIRF